MKNSRLDVPFVLGMNERQPQPKENADLVENFTVDQTTGAFDSRIGFERFITRPASVFSPFTTTNRIDSIFYWSKRGGALDQILYEANGNLYLLQDWNGQTYSAITLAATRIPSPTSPGAQYAEFGKWLIITTGDSQPLKFQGWPVPVTPGNLPLFTVGYAELPSAPRPRPIETTISSAAPTGAAESSMFLPRIQAGRGQGLGNIAEEDNRFKYKVSFVSNTGSESPLSPVSSPLSWTTPAALNAWRFVASVEIPRGGEDVIARRIYRTVNTGETKTDKSFYYLDTVLNNVDEVYHDVRQTPGLGSSAPLDSSSIRFPARSPRFCAVYSSCLFLDGGEGEDTRLYYSNPLKPDQFSALDFLEVSSRKGGGIRGLISYFNFLIVLRESSVDVVSGTYPNFQLKTILSGIGSTAVNSAATIPELGVVFATFDGVYLFAGNLEYSDKPEVVKLSDPISKTWLRVNRDQLARSAGAYSHKHKEYHLYVCRDGSAVPNLGLVYSMVKRSWSVRSGFPVGCIDTDGQGNLIFGHHTGASAGADSPAGLFVISARRALGVTKSGDSVVDGSAPVWKFRSPWLDFGDPQIKKKVHHVTLYVITTGSNSVTMTVYKDFSSSGTAAGSKVMQRTDYTDQPRYDFNLLDTPGTVWNDQLVTEIRWDVHTGAASHFLFEISGSTDILLVGYAVDYTASHMKIIRGRSS